jgi:hypothetical protein
MDVSDNLVSELREILRDNIDYYNVPAIVQDIRDRYGSDVETLEAVDADTLHAIISANEV